MNSHQFLLYNRARKAPSQHQPSSTIARADGQVVKGLVEARSSFALQAWPLAAGRTFSFALCTEHGLLFKQAGHKVSMVSNGS